MSGKEILVRKLLFIAISVVFVTSVNLPIGIVGDIPPPNPRPPIPWFPCDELPKPPPATNVNSLAPGNIQVVMALGDSVTAGFGMKSYHFYDGDELIEFRGDSFVIGGTGNNTVPSYLLRYNPDIVGMSVNTTFPWDAIEWEGQIVQPWDAPITRLNAAQSGALISQLPSQVDYITNQILTTFNESINMEEDWKLLTIFIGANNICRSCTSNNFTSPDYFEEALEEVIEKSHQNLPRTFVSIIQLFNISQVWNFAQTSDYCEIMWDTVCHSECPCIHNSTEAREIMDRHTVWYNERIEIVAKRWQAKNITDFTVKVQPFLRDMIIPDLVGLYALSELDCFHPSGYADGIWSMGYWNNLLTPDEYKETAVDYMDFLFYCPDETTVLH